MLLQPLKHLYDEHDGKVSDKWTLYLSEYDRIFAEYRNRPVRILEIGVQNGGSLEILAKYFPRAALIVGCDINPACGALRFAASNAFKLCEAVTWQHPPPLTVARLRRTSAI